VSGDTSDPPKSSKAEHQETAAAPALPPLVPLVTALNVKSPAEAGPSHGRKRPRRGTGILPYRNQYANIYVIRKNNIGKNLDRADRLTADRNSGNDDKRLRHRPFVGHGEVDTGLAPRRRKGRKTPQRPAGKLDGRAA
jgi:hypothetical protein